MRYPFWSQTAVATSKSVVADAGTQRLIEKKEWEDMDWKRTSVFGTFGFCKSLGCCSVFDSERKVSGADANL